MKWISVKDRLPAFSYKEYLVCTTTGFVTELTFVQGRWFGDIIDNYWDRFVTHWMPLPKSPKELK